MADVSQTLCTLRSESCSLSKLAMFCAALRKNCGSLPQWFPHDQTYYARHLGFIG